MRKVFIQLACKKYSFGETRKSPIFMLTEDHMLTEYLEVCMKQLMFY